MALIRLSNAVGRYQREEDAPANRYDWYRRDAKRSGSVSIDRVHIPASKVSGAWCVDEDDFERAIRAHRERIAERKAVTIDYDNRLLRGDLGDWVDTDWGRYQVRDQFHLAWNRNVPRWKGSGEYWRCSSCWQPAETEHNRPECHRCADWNGCGHDCTLSRVFCSKCGTTLDV